MLSSLGKPANSRHIFRTGSQSVFLSAAENKRLDTKALSYIQKANTPWAMRRECAPTRKSVMILSDLAAAFVLQSVGVFLLFLYLTVIVKLDFGNR